MNLFLKKLAGPPKGRPKKGQISLVHLIFGGRKRGRDNDGTVAKTPHVSRPGLGG